MRVYVSIALALVSLLGALACQTAEQEQAAVGARAHGSSLGSSKGSRGAAALADRGTLQPKTILPDTFDHALTPEKASQTITVPGAMLRTSQISRPRAEVRSGPGTQFDLEEFVLEQGAPVLLFDKIGVWQKVLVVGTWKKGWVHTATLAPSEPRKAALTLEARLLPTVSAMHPIDGAKRFPDEAAIKVEIPKGTMFRSLMFNGHAALVVLPETNSVMWVSRKDVQ